MSKSLWINYSKATTSVSGLTSEVKALYWFKTLFHSHWWMWPFWWIIDCHRAMLERLWCLFALQVLRLMSVWVSTSPVSTWCRKWTWWVYRLLWLFNRWWAIKGRGHLCQHNLLRQQWWIKWKNRLESAVVVHSGKSYRLLFSLLLTYTQAQLTVRLERHCVHFALWLFWHWNWTDISLYSDSA